MSYVDRNNIKDMDAFKSQYISRKQFAERMYLVLDFLTWLQILNYINGFEEAVKVAQIEGKKIHFKFGTFFSMNKPYIHPKLREKITLENYPYFVPPAWKAQTFRRAKMNAEGIPLFPRERYYEIVKRYLPMPTKELRTITKIFELLVLEAMFDHQRIKFRDFYVGGYQREPYLCVYGREIPAKDKFPFASFSQNYTICYCPELEENFRPYITYSYMYFSGTYLYVLGKYQGLTPDKDPHLYSFSHRDWSRQVRHLNEEKFEQAILKMNPTDEELLYTTITDYTLPQALLYARITLSKIRKKHIEEKTYDVPVLLDLPPRHIWKEEFQHMSDFDLYKLINGSAIERLNELEYLLDEEDKLAPPPKQLLTM